MRNRFAVNQKRSPSALREILLPICAFAAILGLFFYGLDGVGKTSEEERLRSVEQAVTRATVQCYAIEGQYPPNLEYLEANYGLSLDRQRYIIQYDVFASNIMPTILVLPRNFQNTETLDDGGLFNAF